MILTNLHIGILIIVLILLFMMFGLVYVLASLNELENALSRLEKDVNRQRL